MQLSADSPTRIDFCVWKVLIGLTAARFIVDDGCTRASVGEASARTQATDPKRRETPPVKLAFLRIRRAVPSLLRKGF
jgi:hypothetical protein